MIYTNVKVSWVEERYITPPDKYNPYATKEDWDYYFEEVKKAKTEIKGIVIDIIDSLFSESKAIIKGEDNKIHKISISELNVIE